MKHFNYPRNLLHVPNVPNVRWRQAAKKKDKAGDGAEAEKPKPVAFGCEAGHHSSGRAELPDLAGTVRQDCNWYVCADCHGKKGEKQWQCMLQADSNLGFCHVLPCFASWLVINANKLKYKKLRSSCKLDTATH